MKRPGDIDYSKEFFNIAFPELDYNEYSELACVINVEDKVKAIKDLLPRYLHLITKSTSIPNKYFDAYLKIDNVASTKIIDHYRISLLGKMISAHGINSRVIISAHRSYIRNGDSMESTTEEIFNQKLSELINSMQLPSELPDPYEMKNIADYKD